MVSNVRSFVAVSIGILLLAPSAIAVNKSITEYGIGITPGSGPTQIISGPDENLWFSEYGGNRIGKITAAGVITEYGLGNGTGKGPLGIAVGSDGNIWFTEVDANKIGTITNSGVIKEYSIGTSSDSGPNAAIAGLSNCDGGNCKSSINSPHGITAGSDGNMWFTQPNGDKIGKISTKGVVTEYSLGITAGSYPWGIATGSDGNMWFTEANRSVIGKITPAGIVTEYSASGHAGINPWGITSGPDGNLWFTDAAGIGKITTAGAITEYSAGISDGGNPNWITSGPDGNLWFTEYDGNRIGKITPEGVISEYGSEISAGSHPWGITKGPDGNLWFTEYRGMRVGRIDLNSTLSPILPMPSGLPTLTSIPSAKPMNVDAPSSVLVVTTTNDSVNGNVSSPSSLAANPGNDGISLREAIIAANAEVGFHAITFASSLAGKTISPLTPLPPITQDHTTIFGLTSADSQPDITIDAFNNVQNCCEDLLAIEASDVLISHLNIINVRGTGFGISVLAGQPGGTMHVQDVIIEQNVLDNKGQNGGGLLVGTHFDPYVTGATLNRIRVTGNAFRGYSDGGIRVDMVGSHGLLKDLFIEDNAFSENLAVTFPSLEIATNFSDNEISGTRILRNSFANNWVGIFIQGGVGGTRPDQVPIRTSGNLITDTVISQNTFIGNESALRVVGGDGGTNATGNNVTQTEISNNLFSHNTSDAIGVYADGGQGASGNTLNGIQIVNDTIAYNVVGISIVDNCCGANSNDIAKMEVLNTIFWLNSDRDFGGRDALIVPFTVQSSIVNDQGFAKGNISGDPGFVSAQDFHLKSGSVAIGSGTRIGAPTIDIEDRLRSTVDIGAYAFGSPVRPRLTVSLLPFGGTGTVTSTPEGIKCPDVCSSSFDLNTSVTLIAIPDPNSETASWPGTCVDGNICTVKIDAPKTVTTKFAGAPRPTPTPTPTATATPPSSPSPMISKTATTTSITCVKGNLIKKVKAATPKCPKGYRRK